MVNAAVASSPAFEARTTSTRLRHGHIGHGYYQRLRRRQPTAKPPSPRHRWLPLGEIGTGGIAIDETGANNAT
jgi:hypothetical protein